MKQRKWGAEAPHFFFVESAMEFLVVILIILIPISVVGTYNYCIIQHQLKLLNLKIKLELTPTRNFTVTVGEVINHYTLTYDVWKSVGEYKGWTSFGKQRTWFELLGCLPSATKAEINAAWRTKVKKAHPDVGGFAVEIMLLNTARDQGLSQALS